MKRTEPVGAVDPVPLTVTLSASVFVVVPACAVVTTVGVSSELLAKQNVKPLKTGALPPLLIGGV